MSMFHHFRVYETLKTKWFINKTSCRVVHVYEFDMSLVTNTLANFDVFWSYENNDFEIFIDVGGTNTVECLSRKLLSLITTNHWWQVEQKKDCLHLKSKHWKCKIF